jgi:transcriptional regulator GlxA family with amidase domain
MLHFSSEPKGMSEFARSMSGLPQPQGYADGNGGIDTGIAKMNRRDLLTAAAAAALVTAETSPALAAEQPTPHFEPKSVKPLRPPSKGKIPVAFLISSDAQVIDFTGPWEVFQDVHVSSRGTTMDERMPFELFTVAESTAPIRATGGLKIVPDHDFASASAPRLIVVPAQQQPSAATKEWLKKAARQSDVTMSVCTGAFVLGAAGLLSGQAATTHHEFYDRFAEAFPDVQLKRGVRFVENDRISTAGGLTSGIDLALHVVERYFGADVAQRTAVFMEHESGRWKV